MRALFGVLSLLVVLAIVGLLAAKQFKAAALVPASADAAAPASPGASGTLRETSRQIQQQVQSDTIKALEQGAAARQQQSDDATKP